MAKAPQAGRKSPAKTTISSKAPGAGAKVSARKTAIKATSPQILTADEQPIAAVTTKTEEVAQATPEMTEKETQKIGATSAAMAPNVPEIKGNPTMTDTMATAKAYSEKMSSQFQNSMSEMNEKAKSTFEKSSQTMEEMGDIAKGNLEAMMASSKIAAKGVETMGQDAAEFSRQTMEKTTSVMKSFAAIKSPTEFFQMQSELLSATMEAFAAEAAKNSEAMMKLAGEAAQPLSTRMAVVSDKMKSLAV